MMDNKLSELSKPVAEVVSKFGDPEAFGERDIKLLTGIQQMAYGTKFYSQEYVSALDKVAQYWIGESAGWKKRAADAEKRIAELEGQLQSGFTPEALAQEERAENAKQRVAELEAKLATPVRLPKRWDVSGQVNPPRIVEVQFEQQNRTHDQCAKAIRNAGFTVILEGDE